MTTTEIEDSLQQEIMTCPECGDNVITIAAEGIPAQQLRHGSCGHDFMMDLDSKPVYNETQQHGA
jgi:hypothetical protein